MWVQRGWIPWWLMTASSNDALLDLKFLLMLQPLWTNGWDQHSVWKSQSFWLKATVIIHCCPVMSFHQTASFDCLCLYLSWLCLHKSVLPCLLWVDIVTGVNLTSLVLSESVSFSMVWSNARTFFIVFYSWNTVFPMFPTKGRRWPETRGGARCLKSSTEIPLSKVLTPPNAQGVQRQMCPAFVHIKLG